MGQQHFSSQKTRKKKKMRKGVSSSTFYAVLAALSTLVIISMSSSWFNFFGSSGSPSSEVSTKVIVSFSSPSISEDPRFTRMSQEFKVSMRKANIRAARGESVSTPAVKSIDEMIERDPELSAKLAGLKREHREFEQALPKDWKIVVIQRENGQVQPAESFVASNTVTGKK